MDKRSDETRGNDGDDMRVERRSAPRAAEDADWESKVVRRVSGHLRDVTGRGSEQPGLGWEATVLDTLRRRIERESK